MDTSHVFLDTKFSLFFGLDSIAKTTFIRNVINIRQIQHGDRVHGGKKFIFINRLINKLKKYFETQKG